MKQKLHQNTKTLKAYKNGIKILDWELDDEVDLIFFDGNRIWGKE